jgi:hypothetical protein
VQQLKWKLEEDRMVSQSHGGQNFFNRQVAMYATFFHKPGKAQSP